MPQMLMHFICTIHYNLWLDKIVHLATDICLKHVFLLHKRKQNIAIVNYNLDEK